MTGYIAKILQQFIHPTEKKPAHQHHQHVHPQYGTKVQLTEPEDKTLFLQPKDIKKLQQITGAMLYYERAVYFTFMTNLNELAYAQTNGTQATMRATEKLMD